MADSALERGDVTAAIGAVDRRAVWRAREVQSLARLAEAHLRLDDPGAWFHKAHVLATLAYAYGGRPGSPREVPCPDATWDSSRLYDLNLRCAAWLEEG